MSLGVDIVFDHGRRFQTGEEALVWVQEKMPYPAVIVYPDQPHQRPIEDIPKPFLRVWLTHTQSLKEEWEQQRMITLQAFLSPDRTDDDYDIWVSDHNLFPLGQDIIDARFDDQWGRLDRAVRQLAACPDEESFRAHPFHEYRRRLWNFRRQFDLGDLLFFSGDQNQDIHDDLWKGMPIAEFVERYRERWDVIHFRDIRGYVPVKNPPYDISYEEEQRLYPHALQDYGGFVLIDDFADLDSVFG